MAAMMEKLHLVRKRFEAPDEHRTFDKGEVAVVNLDGTKVSRYTLEPGWRWSDSVRPLVGTESCEVPHLQYVLEGNLRIHMDDGTERDYGPGDLAAIPPGHDGWVVGDEPAVLLEFESTGDYAKPRH